VLCAPAGTLTSAASAAARARAVGRDLRTAGRRYAVRRTKTMAQMDYFAAQPHDVTPVWI
jgi:hypothetical protein